MAKHHGFRPFQLKEDWNEDFFHCTLVAAISLQPPAPAEDLVLIDRLKAKSGLEDIEFFVFTDRDIFIATYEIIVETTRDYFAEEARKMGEDINLFSAGYGRAEGKEVVILSSEAFNELKLQNKEMLSDLTYPMLIAHELGHKYMLKNEILSVVEDFLDHFHEEETREQAAFLYEEFFANNFADLLLSQKSLSRKNIAEIFRKTRADLMRITKKNASRMLP